jgi:hypothetical protein
MRETTVKHKQANASLLTDPDPSSKQAGWDIRDRAKGRAKKEVIQSNEKIAEYLCVEKC